MKPKEIFVVQIGRIGDMILTTPLLRSLKKLYPHSRISVLSSKANAIVSESCPFVDKTIVFRKNPVSDLAKAAMNHGKADLWIDAKPEHSNTSELLLKLFAPLSSLGYRQNSQKFNSMLDDKFLAGHYVDIYLAAAVMLGFHPVGEDRIPVIVISKDIESKLNGRLSTKNKFRILLNLSAGNLSRELSAKDWNEVLLSFSDHDLQKIVICAPKDRVRFNDVCVGTDAVFINTETILDAAALVKNSDIVISPDTSIVHLCSAFNVPVVAMYPNVEWNLIRFYPLSERKELLISDSREDIKSIKPQDVYEAFLRLYNDTISGNAESRTRVRKEDH